MVAQFRSASSRFDPNELHGMIVNEGVKHPCRVRSSSDAGDHDIGQLADLVQTLFARFFADHRLEVANDFWERVGPHDASRM